MAPSETQKFVYVSCFGLTLSGVLMLVAPGSTRGRRRISVVRQPPTWHQGGRGSPHVPALAQIRQLKTSRTIYAEQKR